MMNSSSKTFSPGRLFLPGCAVAAGLLTVKPSAPVWAAPANAADTAKNPNAPGVAVLLGLGQTAAFPLPAGATFAVESGTELVAASADAGTLQVKALKAGEVSLFIQVPDRPLRVWNLRLIDRSQKVVPAISRVSSLQVQPAPGEGALPAPVTPPGEGIALPATSAPATTELAAPAPMVEQAPLPQPLTGLTPEATAPVDLPPVATTPATPPPVDLAPPVTMPGEGGPAVFPLPALTPSTAMAPPLPVTAPPAPAPQISPVLPPPIRTNPALPAFNTSAGLPQGIKSPANSSAIPVSQGLARLLSFPSNILAVFFSDQNVMDARAINARTVAVTGVAQGYSTLAVFTARYPGDVVGKANIYRIQTTPKNSSAGSGQPVGTTEQAIVAALNDPRIRVSVIRLPDGSDAVRLTGALRNGAEVQAAATTAAYFVPKVISSLYADAAAPTLIASQTPSIPGMSPTESLQDNLRRITGNSSVELVGLPGGLIFKATVNSTDEADAMMRLLSSLNQPVQPFIVVRGANDTSNVYSSQIPVLQGEDLIQTQRLQDVTGVRTVYAVRASSNGLAIYGTARNRSEFDRVRRYALIMAQQVSPPALAGTSQGGANLQPLGIETRLPANSPASGNAYPVGVQFFVRIVDPAASVIRKVTIETNVVEIARSALRNLGLEYGTSQLTGDIITPGTASIVNGTTIVTDATRTRSVDLAFNQGIGLAGQGVSGFQNQDPLRVRINALYQNGNARLLSRPNVSAIEGGTAQITIGGSRPVPQAVASGSGGAVGQNVEFRKFGVILTMRPTVSDDNTILLQISADITTLEDNFGVTLNGARIPGESVRSVDTTIAVRAGDVVIMGGLMTNERRAQTSKVPVLGDLPIIGSLFQSRRFENNQSELAIFLMPQLEFLPATPETIESVLRVPAMPGLPGVQENNPILVQGGR